MTAVSLAVLTLTALPARAAAPAPAAAAAPPADDLAGWAETTSDLVGVPERALLALFSRNRSTPYAQRVFEMPRSWLTPESPSVMSG